MKKLKKLAALLIASVMLLSLAACGNTNSTTSEPPGSNGNGAAKTGVLKIGALANITGWFSIIDSANVNELKAMAKIINDEGGLVVGDTTYTIEIDVQDGQSDATGIRNAAQILANNGCKYVIETNDFWVEGALDIFESNGIMNIQAQNNMDFNAINENLKYAYTFCNGAAASYVSAFQAFVAKYPDVKSVVYCQNDDGVNEATAILVRNLCEEYSLEYIDSPVIYDASAPDFSAIALQVIASGADAFIGNGQPTNIASILKEVRNNGSSMVCAATVTQPGSLLLETAGVSASNRAFTLGPDLTTEANNTEIFWKIYQQVLADYGEEASSSFTGNFANCLYVLTNLMQECGSVEVEDVMAYWNTISSVESIYGTGLIGGTETYGCNHLLATPNPLSMLVDGQIEFGGWYDTIVP